MPCVTVEYCEAATALAGHASVTNVKVRKDVAGQRENGRLKEDRLVAAPHNELDASRDAEKSGQKFPKAPEPGWREADPQDEDK